MKYIETFEKFSEQDRCNGCGAALNPTKNKCEYCGSHYKVKQEPKSDDRMIKKNYWDDYKNRSRKLTKGGRTRSSGPM